MESSTSFVNPTQFIESFAENKKLPKFVAIFYSGLDAEGKQFWCSDTVQADPFVKKYILPKLDELKIKYQFIDCLDKTTFRDPNFPLRSSHQIAKVPTVVYYQEGVEKSRLVENEAYEEKTIEPFLAAL